MGAEHGLRAIVGAELTELGAEAEAARDAAAGDQLAMFDPPTRFTGAEGEAQRDRARTGRPGRPPGALNRVNADMRGFLRARGFDPLTWKVAWAQHSPESLARELGCPVADAWDRLNALYGELMGYFWGKAAPVDARGQAVPMFVMELGASVSIAAPGAGAGAVPPWLLDPRRQDLEQDQSVSNSDGQSDGAVSHAIVSHEEPK